MNRSFSETDDICTRESGGEEMEVGGEIASMASAMLSVQPELRLQSKTYI